MVPGSGQKRVRQRRPEKRIERRTLKKRSVKEHHAKLIGKNSREAERRNTLREAEDPKLDYILSKVALWFLSEKLVLH